MKITKPLTDCEVEFNILADGRPCQEYVLPDADDEPTAGVCFIPVPDGATITIHGTFTGSVLEGRVDVLADGAFVANRIIEHPRGKEGVIKRWENRRIEFKTFLNVPDINDHKQRLRPKVVAGDLVAQRLPREDLARPLHGGDDATGIGVGSITLVVSLNQDVFDTYGAENVAAYPSVGIKSWRDRIADVAGSGIEPELEMEMAVYPDANPVADKRATLFWRDLKAFRPGTEAWAYFIFYYRTQAAIDAAGCLPSTGSKALPEDGGLFIRAHEQEIMVAQEISSSCSSSSPPVPIPAPAHETKRKMGLGQALVIPETQSTRNSASQSKNSTNVPQQQPQIVGTPNSQRLSQTQQPTPQETQDDAVFITPTPLDEKKAQVRNDVMRDMDGQQHQQAPAMSKGPTQTMRQEARRGIEGVRASVESANDEQQQNIETREAYCANMSPSAESEKDSLFESTDEATLRAENYKTNNVAFDHAPPLAHPLLSSKHADNVFQTPKPRVSFSDPLTIGSAKDLRTSDGTIHGASSKHEVDDLASPSLPVFESRSPRSRPALSSSNSPTAKSPTKASDHVKPAVRPQPRKRPISQLEPAAAVPTTPSTTEPPSTAKRFRSEEMQQRKAQLEADLKAKRERKAAIKKANDEEASNRQKQQRLWAEEDARRRAEEEKRREEARRREVEEEEARKAEEAFLAEMAALERENQMEDEDLESEIEKGERQRREWEDIMRARGCSE